MSLRNVGIVFRKELLDIARDRRTLIFMILLPIAIIPLLTLAMGKITQAGIERLQETPSRVALVGTEHAPPQLVEFLRSLETIDSMQAFFQRNLARLDPFVQGMLMAGLDRNAPPPSPVDAAEALEKAKKVKILVVVPWEAPEREFNARADAAIAERLFDAIIVFSPGFARAIEEGHGAEYTIVTSDAEERSAVARHKIEGFFELGARGITHAQLARKGLPGDVLTPIKSKRLNVGREDNFLARLLPYLIILMCFSGGLYPAIDLGAGEKERGTLETLLVCPARRIELVLGKFVVVVLAAIVAALLNVASLSVTLGAGFLDIPGMALRFDLAAALVTLLLMLPTAAIFASILLSVSIFARSFKEAQSYTIPFNFLIIIPAFFSLIPGFELTPTLALVPVLNVSMALKEIWVGTYRWGSIALIFGSTLAYAAAAVWFCASWFRRESVLFRS